MPRIELNGADFNYSIAGPADGRLVILLHGGRGFGTLHSANARFGRLNPKKKKKKKAERGFNPPLQVITARISGRTSRSPIGMDTAFWASISVATAVARARRRTRSRSWSTTSRRSGTILPARRRQ